MRRAIVGSILLFLVVSVAAKNDNDASQLLVSTTLGAVQGKLDAGNNVRLWSGIPYARPPVGDLRFDYPVSAEKYNGVYQADFTAPGCPQLCKLPPGNCPATTSEDCLYLSIFAPTTKPKSPAGYPVLFWMHGGAYEQGLGNCALYNGTSFAQQDTLTVVINYRLGALGFMASKSLKGNYGMIDQRLAMEWTRDNIHAFGGDPASVTIAGQSAGAMSVSSHLTSPNSKGLFARAIMESNPLGMPYHTRTTAQTNADAVFAYLHCDADDVACVRSKSVAEILEAQDKAIGLDKDTLFINFLPFAPMVEKGGELPDQPLNLLMRGEMQAVPVLSGSMLDEGQLFVHELFTKPMSKLSYHSTLDVVFGRSAKHIKDAYPMDVPGVPPGSTDGRDAFNILATDLLFYCPLRNVTRGYQSVLSAAATPTYIYRFKHVLSFDCWGPDYPFCVGVVCHGSELPFVWNVFSDGVISYEHTSSEAQLAADLSAAWVNFAHTGNPNGNGVAMKFPLYDGSVDPLVVLDEPGYSEAAEARSAYCDLWDSLGYLNW